MSRQLSDDGMAVALTKANRVIENLTHRIGDLRASLDFALEQLDELVDRHYGGELPCDAVQRAKLVKARALVISVTI